MTTEERAAVHRALLEALGADDGPLTARSRYATSQNPEWFNVRRREPRLGRRQLHAEILARFTDSHPEVRRDRKAIVLAGPPGAGKSTAQNALIRKTRGRSPDTGWLSTQYQELGTSGRDPSFLPASINLQLRRNA
ncbi:hypothetical protein [Arthrobacter sp. M4]|uniref:hypothetical protein n=1 Tax=Arthrobacter sp. M4 TaxID=218160 RepID=UPI001CDCBFDF|nr:hypothetical protein [Arthrobacter sp. M4]MCA4135302.1 hypothetical protein [Arthrobacter sp. M4]